MSTAESLFPSISSVVWCILSSIESLQYSKWISLFGEFSLLIFYDYLLVSRFQDHISIIRNRNNFSHNLVIYGISLLKSRSFFWLINKTMACTLSKTYQHLSKPVPFYRKTFVNKISLHTILLNEVIPVS